MAAKSKMEGTRNDGIPCLSVRQPWAELIAAGPKRIENRPWATKYRGWLGIHAGKTYDAGADDFYFQLAFGVDQSVDRSRMIFGAVIAVARLVACIDYRAATCDDWTANRFAWVVDDPWFDGPVAWVLDEVRRIEPVYCRGGLQLFYPAEFTS